ncbi:uncharacterized protein V2V93DRAFT_317312, partial [Kockiozyma suomiensis]|uniref:uncharacterized protein n=1 Tax=Kockiozyma suomiensis TaxID=1337062 RepID=UPI0033433F74
LSRRKYETTTDRYLGPRDPRYVRILIRCWPPPKGLSQYLKIKKFMSGFGDLLEFYHPQLHDYRTHSNGYIAITYFDPADTVYTGLAEEFRCFHDIPNYFLKENFEDRRRLLESLGMDSDVPHIFLVLRHTVSVEERGIRTMLKSARVKNNERSINDRVKLLDQLADRLVYGFEGFHNN